MIKAAKIFPMFLLLLSTTIYSASKIDSSNINADSIKSDYTFSKIKMSIIDSSKISKSDSLILGRFIKNQSPIINDWQLYLPYDDTLKVYLYNKNGNIVANLFDNFLLTGYYQLKVLPHNSPSDMYIILFKTSKDTILSKFILMH